MYAIRPAKYGCDRCMEESCEQCDPDAAPVGVPLDTVHFQVGFFDALTPTPKRPAPSRFVPVVCRRTMAGAMRICHYFNGGSSYRAVCTDKTTGKAAFKKRKTKLAGKRKTDGGSSQ